MTSVISKTDQRAIVFFTTEGHRENMAVYRLRWSPHQISQDLARS